MQHHYRYVNAVNVYNKGKAAGAYNGTANYASYTRSSKTITCTSGTGWYLFVAHTVIKTSTNCTYKLLTPYINSDNSTLTFISLIKATNSSFTFTTEYNTWTYDGLWKLT